MSHDDGGFVEYTDSINNEEISLDTKTKWSYDTLILANTMQRPKDFVACCQYELHNPQNKKYKSVSLQISSEDSYSIQLYGRCWHISSSASGLPKSISIIYSIPICEQGYLTKVCNCFEEIRQIGKIQECFGKDFPSIIVYDKSNNYLKLIFSTQNVVVPKIEVPKVPTAEEFINSKLEKLKKENPKDFNNVQIFLKNADYPLFKKKKFLAGEKIYKDISKSVPLPPPEPIIIDNNKQDKLKSYNDINELVKGA